MKCLNPFLLLFLFLTTTTLFAQNEAITDEELKKYAVVMDSVDNMSSELMETITELVKSNDQITAARYNDLYKIIGNEEELAEQNATPEEIEAVKAVLKKKDEGTAKIQETFKSLATEYVGAATYNKVKKALASDADVKARYDAILADLNKDDTE